MIKEMMKSAYFRDYSNKLKISYDFLSYELDQVLKDHLK